MRYLRQSSGQIKALQSFTLADGSVIAANTLGGTIATVRNLSQSGSAWIFPGASVTENAQVYGNAVVRTGGTVSGSARVSGNALVRDNGLVTGEARVYGNAVIGGGQVGGKAKVTENASVLALAVVQGEASVSGSAIVTGANALVTDNAKVQGEAVIQNGKVRGTAKVLGKVLLEGTVTDKGHASGCCYIDGTSVVQCNARIAGCVKLRNTILDCNAIVYKDDELIDEHVTDPGRVTCPDKNPVNCCP